MKNLLISAISLIVVCLAVSSASADPVQKDVVRITIKNMKSGYEYAHFVFPEPIKAQQKTCPDDRTHDCVYGIAGKTKKELYRFDDSELVMVTYVTETKVQVAAR